MAKATSLEEFLKKYTSGRASENEAMSLDEYTASLGLDPTRDYVGAMTGAMARKRTSDTGYGRTREELHDAGLAGGGYAEYLTQKANDTLVEDMSDALGAKLDAESEIDAGYAKYLKSYKDKQAAKATAVRNRLLSNEVVNPDTSYAIAVNAGLSADDAAAVSAEVYSVMRDRIFTDCLERVASLELDATGARLYAKSMGLTDADADSLASEAAAYLRYYKDYAGSYLEYLESNSDSPR